MARAESGRKDFLAEVLVGGLVQHIHERFAIENIDAHAREQVPTVGLDPALVDPGRVHLDQFRLFIGLRLFEKTVHAASVVTAHDTQ